MRQVKVLAISSMAALFLTLSGTVAAQAPFPMTIAGKANIDGQYAAENTTVSAMIDGRSLASSKVRTDGSFALLIPQAGDARLSGKTINFRVGELAAASDQRIAWMPAREVIGVTVNARTAVRAMDPEIAFADIIKGNNLLRVWHFNNLDQNAPETGGWSIYDTREVFMPLNTIDMINPGEFYWLQVIRDQSDVLLGSERVDLVVGWNPIRW